jgi:hypothetical protein
LARDGGTPHGQRLYGRQWGTLAEQVAKVSKAKNPDFFFGKIA